MATSTTTQQSAAIHSTNKSTSSEMKAKIDALYPTSTLPVGDSDGGSATLMSKYGGSMIAVALATFIVVVGVFYCYAKLHVSYIQANWTQLRCKPYVLPIAGLISPDGNTTTASNFVYCMQNIQAASAGSALEPLTYASSLITNTLGDVAGAIQDARTMFSQMRTAIASIVQDIMNRLLNTIIPIQQMIIEFRDFVGKLQGTMTAALYTLFGSYMSMQSLMGVIAKFIVGILIALAAMIAIFWIMPFTWGAAITNTAIFVAIATPMALILTFLSNVMGISTGLNMPHAPTSPHLKCFHPDTLICGVPARHLRVGDVLRDGHCGTILAVIRVEMAGSTLYQLPTSAEAWIIVSDTHYIWNAATRQWCRVSEHPDAQPVQDTYPLPPYLVCLSTTSGRICVGNYTFSDWNEIQRQQWRRRHPHSRHGHAADTMVYMADDIERRPMRNIRLGDILANNNRVYGVVEMPDNTRHLLTDQPTFAVADDACTDSTNKIHITNYDRMSEFEMGYK